eukprot:gnl/MRDRNA2_/MRDRNA2_35015_c0_seq1.p1 gnl/MRDRNA2_/MRDRNA2_35015_c0~~gnl/MRDRNA2_/MRDRNA2_35015_c0_seq1.p1  ORF type:complete len:772 (+),score=144.81 gnl/MRDRNA2_/MRDRNA2_35015_c0_seq1:110-2425(+)
MGAVASAVPCTCREDEPPPTDWKAEAERLEAENCKLKSKLRAAERKRASTLPVVEEERRLSVTFEIPEEDESQENEEAEEEEWQDESAESQTKKSPHLRRYTAPESFADASWLEDVVAEMWPGMRHFIENGVLRGIVEPCLQRRISSHLCFERCSLGDTPPIIRGVKAYRDMSGLRVGQQNSAELAMNLEFLGNDVDASLKIAKTVSVGITRLYLQGTFCVMLRKFISAPPFLSGVTFFFMNAPECQVDFAGGVMNAKMPVKLDAVKRIIESQLAAHLVLPNRFPVHLQNSLTYYELKYPPPDGIMEIEILDLHGFPGEPAKNAGNNIQKVLSGSLLAGAFQARAYMTIKLGAGEWRSKTQSLKNNTVSWRENLALIVDKVHGQSLLIEVWSEGNTNMLVSDQKVATLKVTAAGVANANANASWQFGNDVGKELKQYAEWPLELMDEFKGPLAGTPQLLMRAKFRPLSLGGASKLLQDMPPIVNGAKAVLLLTLDSVVDLDERLDGYRVHLVASLGSEQVETFQIPACRADLTQAVGRHREEQLRYLLEAKHNGQDIPPERLAWLMNLPNTDDVDKIKSSTRGCIGANFGQQVRLWVHDPAVDVVSLELRGGRRETVLARIQFSLASLLSRDHWLLPLGQHRFSYVNRDRGEVGDPAVVLKLQLFGTSSSVRVGRGRFCTVDASEAPSNSLAESPPTSDPSETTLPTLARRSELQLRPSWCSRASFERFETTTSDGYDTGPQNGREPMLPRNRAETVYHSASSSSEGEDDK